MYNNVPDVPYEKVLPFSVSEPAVSVKVPSTFTFPASLMPLLGLFNDILLSETAGKSIAAKLKPPIVKLDDPPPDKVPDEIFVAPFRVRVFAPIENWPVLKVRVPSIPLLACKLTLLSI